MARARDGADDGRLMREVLDDPLLNHRVEVVGGVLEPECRELMCLFFAERRTDAGATG